MKHDGMKRIDRKGNETEAERDNKLTGKAGENTTQNLRYFLMGNEKFCHIE